MNNSTSCSSAIALVRETIDIRGLLERGQRPDCGAVLLFAGTTREWTKGAQTVFLEYEAYEAMALLEMQKLADEALKRWPISFVAMVHRLGRVDISEASVAIVVSSAHRHPAFEAGEWLIDELKKVVPIWKKEHSPAGSSEWLHPEYLFPAPFSSRST